MIPVTVEAAPCEHKWSYMRATQRCVVYRYAKTYERTDFFYCEKCLTEDHRSVKAHEVKEPPTWWDTNAPTVNVDCVRSF